MPPSPSTLLFDLDGVLAHYQRADRLAHLGAACGVSAETLHRVLFEQGLEQRYDNGELSSQEYLERLSTSVGRRISARHWVEARLAGMRIDVGTRALIGVLTRQYQLSILTNNGPMIHEVITALFGSDRVHFGDRVFCSGELGISKPDVRVYRAVLMRLARPASDVCFFDDLAENIAGAAATGLNARHIATPSSLPPVLQEVLSVP